MTIEREFGLINFQCDGKRCAEVCETFTGNFEEALEVLEDAGWITRRLGHAWVHVCDSCLEVENGLAL